MKKVKKNEIKLADICPFTFEQNNKFQQNLCLDKLSLLIIDEISTVSSVMLGTLDVRMRHAKEIYNKPFGGYQYFLLEISLNYHL